MKGYPTIDSINKDQSHVVKLLIDLGHSVQDIEHPGSGVKFFDYSRYAFLPEITPLTPRETPKLGKISPNELTPYVNIVAS